MIFSPSGMSHNTDEKRFLFFPLRRCVLLNSRSGSFYERNINTNKYFPPYLRSIRSVEKHFLIFSGIHCRSWLSRAPFRNNPKERISSRSHASSLQSLDFPRKEKSTYFNLFCHIQKKVAYRDSDPVHLRISVIVHWLGNPLMLRDARLGEGGSGG